MLDVKTTIKQLGISTAEWFTYVLIVIVLATTAYGFYLNSRLNSAIAEAVTVGEQKKSVY